jgi:hypothetical protein
MTRHPHARPIAVARSMRLGATSNTGGLPPRPTACLRQRRTPSRARLCRDHRGRRRISKVAPATSDQLMSGPCGTGSPRTNTIASAMAMPVICVAMTTPKSGRRRVKNPPPKSAAPQLSAAARPRTTTASPVPLSGMRHHPGPGHPRGSRTPRSAPTLLVGCAAILEPTALVGFGRNAGADGRSGYGRRT